MRAVRLGLARRRPRPALRSALHLRNDVYRIRQRLRGSARVAVWHRAGKLSLSDAQDAVAWARKEFNGWALVAVYDARASREQIGDDLRCVLEVAPA